MNLPTLFNLISVLLHACRFVGPSWSTCRINWQISVMEDDKTELFPPFALLKPGRMFPGLRSETAWKHVFVCIRPNCRIILGKTRKKNNVLMPSLLNANSQKCHWSLSVWEHGMAKAPISWHSAVCCWPPHVPWAVQIQAGVGCGVEWMLTPALSCNSSLGLGENFCFTQGKMWMFVTRRCHRHTVLNTWTRN